MGLAEALAEAEAGIAALAAADLDAAGDRALLDAVVAQQRLADRLAAVQLATLAAVDRRGCYGLDGAVTLPSWYRNRTRLDPAEASRRVHAAARLPRFPRLAAALADGAVTLGHVTAVTEAAVPNRIDAIAAAEPVLVELARHTSPRDLKTALRRIADHVDTDGTDVQPLDECGPDPRCELHLRPTIDGLHELRGLRDQLDAEALLTALDALDTPDPAGTPPQQRRSPAQRRSDALGALARQALDRGTLPTVQGNRPHLLLTADLTHLLPAHLHTDPAALADRIAAAATADDLLGAAATAEDLLGAAPDRPSAADPAAAAGPGAAPDTAGDPPAQRHLPQEPGRAADLRGGEGPRLRWTGPLPPQRARHLALHAKLTAVLTLGPYRIVNVGRTHRTLPAWLRGPLEAQHRHCRGPDCDRPTAWTEAHHVHAYDDGADTDLNDTVPLCKAHHDLIHQQTLARRPRP